MENKAKSITQFQGSSAYTEEISLPFIRVSYVKLIEKKVVNFLSM